MKSFLRGAFMGVLSASAVFSAPMEKRPARGVSDVDILQFALTLEHLENVFYKGALSRFTENHFREAGFDSKLLQQLRFIAQDEEDHVVFITKALSAAGVVPVSACEYNFPYTDVHSFLALASVLEGVGTSAYLGGARVISNKDILTQAGAILVAEGIHQSVLRNSLNQISSAKVTGTPVDANAIFSLAASFIVSCPKNNIPLPFQAFPTLAPTQPGPQAISSRAHFRIGKNVNIGEGGLFLTFVSGLDIVSVAVERVDRLFAVNIPSVISGQSYVFLTNSEARGSIADNIVVAGPAIIEVTPRSATVNLSIL
ncbi:hypothetical protein I7I51_03582 [Histoplasma capsulatum]|uniref:Ferritin-like domain-containing protein n=1 Tax=Ajellomyces capsulatus TaxID=5037 RepID=A0A8A1M4K8_AJECA|nr:predicted protein [Histoplasma mississippiense (nom. inval.)]EDN07151.1 predicted protein [Histoplasma mississippiense (nom. inval.)]QSS61408.1 hypothetical protein I7I51_03582 [Histoplasma capsulatum]